MTDNDALCQVILQVTSGPRLAGAAASVPSAGVVCARREPSATDAACHHDQADGTELPQVTIRSYGARQDPAARLAESIRDVAGVYPVIVQTREPPVGTTPRSASQDALAFTVTTFPAAGLQATRILLSNDRTDVLLSETLIENDRVSTDAGILFEALSIVPDLLGASGRIFRYAEDTRIASPLMQCMRATDTYRREKSRQSFTDAQRCQESLLANPFGKIPFVISAGALYRTLHR